MTDFAPTIEAIRAAAERFGLPRLSQEAQVPYTTVQSFAKRGWSNKNLDALEKLAAAAHRLEGEGA